MHPIRRFVAPSLAAICTLTLLGATPARADATFYSIFKFAYYSQTSADQPTTPFGYGARGNIVTTSADDIETAQLIYPGPFSPLSLDNFGTQQLFGQDFSSPEQRDAAFPAGAYTYLISGGNLDGQTGFLDVPEPLFTTSTPYFTGATFDNLQHLDAASDYTAFINGFDVVSGANTAHTFIAAYDSMGQFIWGTDFDGSVTEFLIPAGTLLPGQSYTLSVFYSSRIVANDQGLGHAASAVGFDLVTNAPLHTAAANACKPNLITDTHCLGPTDLLGFLNLYFINFDGHGSAVPGDDQTVPQLNPLSPVYAVPCSSDQQSNTPPIVTAAGLKADYDGDCQVGPTDLLNFLHDYFNPIDACFSGCGLRPESGLSIPAATPKPARQSDAQTRR